MHGSPGMVLLLAVLFNDLVLGFTQDIVFLPDLDERFERLVQLLLIVSRAELDPRDPAYGTRALPLSSVRGGARPPVRRDRGS